MSERLSVSQLRWRCEPDQLSFDPSMVEPVHGIVGQDVAVQALQYGLRTTATGQHVFVRGLQGSGRLTLIRGVLDEIYPEFAPQEDYCFVANFEASEQPTLLTIPRGEAPRFQKRIDELVRFIHEDLDDFLQTESFMLRQRKIGSAATDDLSAVVAPFEKELEGNNLRLVTVRDDEGEEESRIVPLLDGEPVSLEDYLASVRATGQRVDEAELIDRIENFEMEFQRINAKVMRVHKRVDRQVQKLINAQVRSLMKDVVADIHRTWQTTEKWLETLVNDVVKHRAKFEDRPPLLERYRVNVLVTHDGETKPPVVAENVPTVQRLVGAVDAAAMVGEGSIPNHMGIHAGSLLRASGGVLVIEAAELVSEPGAWQALMRALRSGSVELTPAESSGTTLRAPSIRPDPIPMRVKVVLVGDASMHVALGEADPSFSEQFQVLADFEDTFERGPAGVRLYAGILQRIIREEKMLSFTANAICALAEHGARLASQKGKITARFSKIASVAREANFRAKKDGAPHVGREDVQAAVFQAHRRNELPSRHYREQVATGMLKVQTTGQVAGQMNGLAVITHGTVSYGFPMRVTATIGPGSEGVIHIEREAELSGQIHSKSFFIVRGLLRYLLNAPHALTFDASIAHEQSYGGIDGDSASGLELCCLLSALSGLPMRQDLAMTGAVDQHGNMLAIGGVNEKIEGFFDTCAIGGLTSTQGVVIPKCNAGDLMLRPDVVEACRAGKFQVIAVEHVLEALELFTGVPAGEARHPAADTALGRALENAKTLWEQSSAKPE